MICADDLDRRITVQRNMPGVANTLGENPDNWSDFKTVFAKRNDLRDSEKVAAGQVSGSLVSRFVIYSTNDSRTITTMDRLFVDTKVWQIHGVKELADGATGEFLEITASTKIK